MVIPSFRISNFLPHKQMNGGVYNDIVVSRYMRNEIIQEEYADSCKRCTYNSQSSRTYYQLGLDLLVRCKESSSVELTRTITCNLPKVCKVIGSAGDKLRQYEQSKNEYRTTPTSSCFNITFVYFGRYITAFSALFHF